MSGTGTLGVTPGTGAIVNTLPPSGQDVKANSLPVVLDSTVETSVGTAGTSALTVQGAASGVALPVSAADGALVALGAKADAAPANPAANGSVVAVLKGIWAALLARLPLDTNGNLKQVLYDVNGAAVSYGGTTPVQGVAGGVAVVVSQASQPLPAGAATATAQTAGNSSLASIDTKMPAAVSGRVPVDGSGVTQPVTAVSLPLPAGAATVAKQPALGTAGTPSADVISIQGVATGVALPADTVVRSSASSRSGAIVTGGTAQVLAVANASRRGFSIQNQSQGNLWFSGLGGATADNNSLLLAPGDLYESAPQHIGTGAISIVGATAGQAFYAREF